MWPSFMTLHQPLLYTCFLTGMNPHTSNFLGAQCSIAFENEHSHAFGLHEQPVWCRNVVLAEGKPEAAHP